MTAANPEDRPTAPELLQGEEALFGVRCLLETVAESQHRTLLLSLCV